MVSSVDDALFGGRYELGELLGSGGTGSVRSAHDTVLDRPVAIKVLRSGEADDLTRARLRAEAQLAGQLHHPGIAQIYDYGEERDGARVTPYIVMQHVEGTSLWQVLRERRTLPAPEVMDVVAQVADALQVAHDAGIVHRDLKPANMLITPEGRVVLVDFGIARTADAEPLTQTGTIVGTADYISPEQSAGQSATSRSDLYALGMVAYECLTAHKPFRRETDVATAIAHLREEAPALPGEVPPGVRSLVGQLIRKEPEERPADAAEVALRARALSVADGAVIPPAAPATTAGHDDSALTHAFPAVGAALRSRLRTGVRSAGRSRRVYVAAAVLVAAVAGSVLVAARPAATRVPDLRGMPAAAAIRALHAQGIDAERKAVDDPDGRRGTVMWQRPAPGTRADDETVVVLTVASGRTDLAAGDVLGDGYTRAARALVEKGLVPARATRTSATGVGTVVAVTPTGRLPLGAVVTLTVAVAPAPVAASTTTRTPVVRQPSPHHRTTRHVRAHHHAPRPARGPGRKHHGPKHHKRR